MRSEDVSVSQTPAIENSNKAMEIYKWRFMAIAKHRAKQNWRAFEDGNHALSNLPGQKKTEIKTKFAMMMMIMQ